MKLRSLIYVSDSTISMPRDEWQIDAIVGEAQHRNKKLDVTGALMFTYANFAQVLEGPSSSVGELMRSIGNDSRHTNVRVLEVEAIDRRRFSRWSMAYVGPADLMEEALAPALEPNALLADPSAPRQLMALLVGLVRLGE